MASKAAKAKARAKNGPMEEDKTMEHIMKLAMISALLTVLKGLGCCDKETSTILKYLIKRGAFTLADLGMEEDGKGGLRTAGKKQGCQVSPSKEVLAHTEKMAKWYKKIMGKGAKG